MSKVDRWKGKIPESDLAVYRKAGFGRNVGTGSRAALLNIDTTHMFIDPSYAMCGHRNPELETALGQITTAFRKRALPIYYSRRDDRSHPTYRGAWNYTLDTAETFQYTSDPRADEWPEAWAPRQEDRIVLKNKPSAFFGTALESFMRYDQVDTLCVVGVSTSGCVRAAVTDAFSHNFRVIVVEEATADRSPFAHMANLFDMDMKFADVQPLAQVIALLDDMTKPLG